MITKPLIRFRFDSHGLGDVVHCCHAMKLYQDAGYDVAIQVEPNKIWAWQAAGINIHNGPDLPLHPYYYPGAFFDLSQPDAYQSKIAHLFEIDTEVLPRLGTKDEVWQRVCASRIEADHAITDQAMSDATDFLAGLPHPIFLLHSKGTNWQAEKSIPDGIAFQLILDLLATGGSVVTLDWDGRAPTLGHDRVRAIKPAWGHITLEQFGALCQLADLMIGIDSGPFHLAQWFQIKTLYVSRQIPPVRCCIPHESATYLVPARDHEHWAARGSEWRFIEYHGVEASSRDIYLAAVDCISRQEHRADMADFTRDQVIGVYTYRRVGHDERPLDLLPDGRIGDGAASCERTWRLNPTPRGYSLGIYGDNGGDTCHLALGEDGVWRGKWINFEQMLIELIPIPKATTWNDLEPLPKEPESAPAPVLVQSAAPPPEPVQGPGHPSDAMPDAPVEFYVGIPTYICFDLVDQCIESILASDWLPRRIIVLDNSGGKYPGHPSRRVQVWTPSHNLGAGGSFNFLFPAFDPAPYIQLNDDIEVAPDLLRAMLQAEGGVIVGDGTSAGTAIMIRSETWKQVGPFDPQFWPAYYEDNDWFYRASLLGIHAVCPKSGGFRNNGPSATKARMCPEDRAVVDQRYAINTGYYRDKWGGPPHQEVFTRPFDGVPQS